MTTTKTFGRRDLLRGIGAGAAFLTPIVRDVQAWAAGAPAGNFMVFYTPNGHRRSDFGATGIDGTFTLKSSLAPLEPYKAKLTVMGNLDNPGPSSKGSHEDCVRTLTCVSGGDLYTAQGPSIDWVIAGALGERPLTTSSLWPNAPNWQTKISWKGKGVNDPHVDSAKTVFDNLFGSVMVGTPPPASGGPSAADVAAAQKRSVLDYVKEDANLLLGRLPANQKVKITNHLDAIRELEKKLAPTAPGSTNGVACTTTTVKQRVDAGTAGLTGGPELQAAIEIKLDLLATAFSCGTRHVATLLCQGASDGRNPFGGVNHHDVSHGKGDDPVGTWKKIDAWYAARFAYLMKKLQDLQIIDHTIVAWATEISEEHDQTGFVIPVAGGAGLGLRNGRAFADRDTLSNLWVSIQKAMGVASNDFGAGSSGGVPGLHVPV
jgi:hypothetical protein